MKKLIAILTITVATISCISQKQNLSATTDLLVEYQAVNKGFYKKITIENDTLFLKKDPNIKPVFRKLSKRDRKIIIKGINALDLDKLKNLKAPSEKRFYDGAAAANLKVIKNNKSYETPFFDHGTPPEYIKEMIGALEKVAEKTE